MTLLELSTDYRVHARMLKERITLLETRKAETEEARLLLVERLHMLQTMWREARELAVLTERYYERGYRRNAKYTI